MNWDKIKITKQDGEVVLKSIVIKPQKAE